MTKKTMIYESPQIEFIEVEVEKGFASSNNNRNEYVDRNEGAW